MIAPDDNTFPNNIVDILAVRFEMIDSDLFVVKRALKTTDPNQSIGISAATWSPEQSSLEMRGVEKMEPPLSTYLITIQAFVKDMDEVRGGNVHSVLSRKIRSMLYNDSALRVVLGELSSTLDGSTEAARRWGIRQQRFFANELDSSWLYLSILEFWLETESN